MAEVLVQFSEPIRGPDDRAYTPRACGRVADDGLWEAWIEFVPDGGTPVLRSPRETEQPNRNDLVYWATGLSQAYLEGALSRALAPERPPRSREVDAGPAYQGPRPRHTSSAPPAPRHSILNPFRVYTQGESILRQELTALGEGRLRDMVRAHSLADADSPELDRLNRGALVELIVTAVRRRAG